MNERLQKGFVVDGQRRCPKCCEVKPVTEFNRQRRKRKNGNGFIQRLKPYCKACTVAMNARRGPEDNIARSKGWRLKNADRVKEYGENYRSTAEGKKTRSRIQLTRWHRQRAAGSFTETDIQHLLEAQEGRCAGCRKDIWLCYSIDHKVPISRGGTNCPENLQLLCRPCNSTKSAKPLERWLEEIGADRVAA